MYRNYKPLISSNLNITEELKEFFTFPIGKVVGIRVNPTYYHKFILEFNRKNEEDSIYYNVPIQITKTVDTYDFVYEEDKNESNTI